MKYGLHTDGRKCGPIDPAKVSEDGWTWYDTEAERDAAVPPAPWTERIASTRYEHEIAGTTFTHSDGYIYGADTRREQRGTMSELRDDAEKAKSSLDSSWSEDWWTPQGWVTLNYDDAIAMVNASKDHVRACFQRQKELDAMVADGTITESDLNSGWPT